MKDGERLVWAAAFAAALDKVQIDGTTEETETLVSQAAAKAWFAVEALRKLSEIPSNNTLALAMLRDMAGATN